jgi:hypothetical protein
MQFESYINMSSIVVEYSTKTADDLIQEIRSGELIIPPHQREFCWTLARQQRFVDTVQKGMPTQGILIRNETGVKQSLEDGQQRLTTLRKYFADEFVDEHGKKFSQHTEVRQFQMKAYRLALTRYKHATTEEAIEIFDRHQNGQALSVGERIHSMSEISPFVKFVRTTLLTAGTGLHDRAKAVWGSRAGVDTQRKNLLNAFALCAGYAFGTGAITKKWEDIRRQQLLSRTDWTPASVYALLEQLIGIYEQAEAKETCGGKAILNKQWDLGTFSGCIVHSFKECLPTDHASIAKQWAEFLVETRKDPAMIKDVLHMDVGKARQWTPIRWKMGYLRVFDFEKAERLAAGESDEEESEESDDSDDE